MKDILIIFIYLLIIAVISYIIYSIYNHSNKEKFTVNNDSSITQNYNLLGYEIISSEETESEDFTQSDDLTLDITLKKSGFIKEIYLGCDGIIPYSLKMDVIDTKNNKKNTIDLSKYKIDNKLDFGNNSYLFSNITGLNNLKLSGNKISLIIPNVADTLQIKEIYIYGNNDGEDKEPIAGFVENEVNKESDTSSKYIIEKEVDTLFSHIEIPLLPSDETVELKTKVVYTNNLQNGSIELEETFYTVGEANKIFFDKIILANKVEITITNNGTAVSGLNVNIYSKVPTSRDIQSYKFENNLIDFRDSLNPDAVCDSNELKEINNLSSELLDILDYQEKINTELRELDLNKINLRRQQNQKLEVQNIVNKIDLLTEEYLNRIKNDDDYNNKKFFETIKILNYLKQQLDTRSKVPKLKVNVNIK